jgi:hypothetical protein
MKHKEMKVTWDGIGFVNNRGTSKYWGVCKSLTNDRDWRITVKNEDETITFHTSASTGTITEEMAGHLAAHLYKYRYHRVPTITNIEYQGRVVRLNTISKKIEDIGRAHQQLHVRIETLVLDSSTTNTEVKTPKPVQEVAKPLTPGKLLHLAFDKYSIPEDERKFIAEVFLKTTVSGGMSERGRSILGAVLSSTV